MRKVSSECYIPLSGYLASSIKRISMHQIKKNANG